LAENQFIGFVTMSLFSICVVAAAAKNSPTNTVEVASFVYAHMFVCVRVG
jgi:hypothetical protein